MAVKQFREWRSEVCSALARLAEERGGGEVALEIEELLTELERADLRSLPKVLVKMAALALLEPELKEYLPDAETAERWIAAEREARLEIVRRYAFAFSPDSVVVKYFRWRPLDSTYEYFALVEVVRPGLLPICQRAIEGLPVYANKASMTVVSRKEFIERYKGKKLMAVVHIAAAGEEYFIEELDAEELFGEEVREG